MHTLFVLDEPSIGLHPRDMGRVIGVMRRLRDAGNTLVVVEHDPQIMLEADRLLDMGPGAGEHGGTLVFNGTPAQILRAKGSLTGDYLSGRRRIEPAGAADAIAIPANRKLTLHEASLHNVQAQTLELPLGHLVCVTGVSGSGKSTLVTELLYPALQRHFGKPAELAGTFRRLDGANNLSGVVLVDQSPIGRTTRSNPASFVGAFDPIRAQFAKLPDAIERKYTPGTFSFNSGTGRCPTCGGNGFEHVEMQLLADVYLRCPACNGRRFRDEVLELKIEGAAGRRLNIAEVLDLTVAEAVGYFAQHADVLKRLQPLADVGLGYLRLGQPVPTLSGGEAQRLKLAGYLADTDLAGQQLLIFDEPTTGLHYEDIALLMKALRKLLARGHSLLIIEHNLDVIGAADWLIEMGPEGGDAGGRIVATGTPARFKSGRLGHTGEALAAYAADLDSIADRRARARARSASAPPGVHRSSRRPRAQPQEHRHAHSAQRAHRGDGCLRIGQVDPGLRHHLRRGPAPLPGITERLRAAVRAALAARRCRFGHRHSAHGGHRAAHQPWRPQEHGGHAHRECILSCDCSMCSSACSTARTAMCRSNR